MTPLSPISAGNVAHFLSGDVEFDQRHGLGSVPDVANVEYMGFVVTMRPSVFLDLTPALQVASEGIREHIRSGLPVSMGFLDVDIETEADHCRIRGHEGRHRARAILDLYGDDPIPVAILPAYGARARDVDDAHLLRLAAGAYAERRGSAPDRFVDGPLFDTVFIVRDDVPLRIDLSDLTPSASPGP